MRRTIIGFMVAALAPAVAADAPFTVSVQSEPEKWTGMVPLSGAKMV